MNNPEFVLLTKTSPLLIVPNNKAITKILVFDSTLQGYNEAVKWLKNQPKDSIVHRLIIPFSNDGINDAGDYLCSNKEGGRDIFGTAIHFDKEHVFEIKQISFESETNEKWPFKSKNRMVDFEQAAKWLESRLLLRNPTTGLSVVQTYYNSLGDEEEEVKLLLCVHKFKLGAAKLKKHLLMCGPLLLGYPSVLLHGPFPLGVNEIKQGMMEFIDKRRSIDWDLLPPCKKGFKFQKEQEGWVSVVQNNLQGDIVGLPYGISKDEFKIANPFCDLSNVHEPLVFSSSCSNLLKIETKWDPNFLDILFPTMNEYMKFWLEETQKEMLLLRIQKIKTFETRLLECEFLRTIYVQKRITDERGYEIRAFLDESDVSKRARIVRDFESRFELLELPISRLDVNCASFPVMDIPDSTRDLWLSLL
jgi:hypothetical protein